ncbi:MAG: SDR family NAD(P)-dependent oxidoreductase, partial [Bacteroidia bacterium]
MLVLITGATSGIGKSTAELFAKNGYDLIITGRRAERLQGVKQDLEELGVKVLTLCFDIRKLNEVKASIASIPSEMKQIDILVNNAGLASGLSTIQDGDIDDWEKMIDTNVKGLLYITREIAPL